MLVGVLRPVVMLACLGLACTLRGDGEQGSETRELPAFTAIEVFDGFAATVTVDPALPVGAPVELTVAGDSNALGRLFTVLHGDATLSAAVDPNHLTELSLGPTLTASVPALASGFAEDTSTLEIFGARGELALEVHESASVMLQGGEGLRVTARAIDDGLLTLAGAGPSLDLVVEGAAMVDAGAFTAVTVTVRARGTGAIRVCATEAIEIYGSGSGQVALDCG